MPKGFDQADLKWFENKKPEKKPIKKPMEAEGMYDLYSVAKSQQEKRAVLQSNLPKANVEELFELKGELDELTQDKDAQVVRMREALERWGWNAQSEKIDVSRAA